jgi:hypothetical protein
MFEKSYIFDTLILRDSRILMILLLAWKMHFRCKPHFFAQKFGGVLAQMNHPSNLRETCYRIYLVVLVSNMQLFVPKLNLHSKCGDSEGPVHTYCCDRQVYHTKNTNQATVLLSH